MAAASEDLPSPLVVETASFAPQAGPRWSEPQVLVQEESVTPTPIFGGVMRRTALGTHVDFPAANSISVGGTPPDNLKPEPHSVPGSGIVLPNGLSLYFLDIAPGYQTPMHRTPSVDYVVVVHGTPTLVVPEGPCSPDAGGNPSFAATRAREYHPGQVVVQRGVMHAWANRTDAWTRVLCVVVAAKPCSLPTTDGAEKELGELWLA